MVSPVTNRERDIWTLAIAAPALISKTYVDAGQPRPSIQSKQWVSLYTPQRLAHDYCSLL